ncbi:PREDICTED: putative late blight resistance protein homolog R1B-8 [Ipomoea nil]|uniref:putative late blight resistance protein homolog R1B-8 n=1 Tax=Ipomoea nil TaxID=35883 RepID=UPI000900D644|nr:PREDICTED: putative late blight resistance protein homolog R1B-8 [Ipomoea nil]
MWKNVTENATRLVIGDPNEVCSRILSLSYNQLPHHLKACFLYFGVFLEDYEIPVKKLVKLWAAEGFLGAVKHQNMEEVGMECLKDLVDRSLVIVSRHSYNGKMKTIRIHDLLQDLCLREAQHENLLNVIANDYHDVVGLEILPFFKRKSQHSFSKPCRWTSIRPRCFTVDCFDKFHSLHCVNFFSAGVFSHFKLLRIVDMELTLPVYGDIVLNLVHLRYLALSMRRNFGSLKLKLFELPSLQSLIVRGFGNLDSSHAIEIWTMPQLRNFYADQICSLETSEGVHKKLETISWLGQACCTKDLLTRIPNLKKLGIDGRFSSANPDCLNNFVDLGQLEKLSIRDWHLKRIPCSSFLWATSFLPKLKKLSFIRTSLPWSDVRLIGMLPNLEVLKLIHALIGQEWEPCEGRFRQLKRLVIRNTHLKYWDVTGDHLPVLECLEISECYSLEEIPSGFADITTLALIRLSKCSNSLVTSAKLIQEEQNNYGNDVLLVHY